MSNNKQKKDTSGCLNTGLNAEELPLTRSTSDMTSKRIFIRTFGCQMNMRDSEALAGLFLDEGWLVAERAEEADVILVNTCSVRGHAEQRAISYLGSLKKLKTYNFKLTIKPVIGLIGCMAQNRGEEVFKKMPHINLICGPGNLEKIPDYVNKITDAIRNTAKESPVGAHDARRMRIIDLKDKPRGDKFYRADFREEKNHAQVVISTGCSNYCSYCVVPYVRGELRLRNPEDIINEIRRNLKLEIKKITLLGQNVNDYEYSPQSTVHGQQSVDFVSLLRMIDEIKGVEEINFISSQPRNISKELFTLMAESSKIRKHLHLPFQSGSDRILKLMNRGYTQQKYLEIVDNYRKVVGGSISTDVIVGFPTESQEDFNQTKDILEGVKFSCAYIFKYSPRNSAKSVNLSDDVPGEIKIKRHKILLDLQKSISKKII